MNHLDSNEEALGALRQLVHDDPALQAQLFALTGSADFAVAVQELASSAGHALEMDAISQAMDAGHRAWLERMLP